MKSVTLLVFLLLFSSIAYGFTYDYLPSATATGSVESASNGWEDVVSTTFNIHTTSTQILVTASIDMWPTGSNDTSCEVHYQLVCNGVAVGEIQRTVEKNATGEPDHGMGSLVHIFLPGVTGSQTISVQHRNASYTSTKKVTSRAVLSIVSLRSVNGKVITSDNDLLDNDASTVSSTYSVVDDGFGEQLSTWGAYLALDGDFYVAASIGASGSANGGPVGEWVLYYQEVDSEGTAIGSAIQFGQPIQRNMTNKADAGMISLVAMLEDLTGGKYYKFYVAHRNTGGGTVTTLQNSSIVAISLNYTDGGSNCFLPSINSVHLGDVDNLTGAYETITSDSFTSMYDVGAENPDVFIHAQFNLEGSGAITGGYEFEATGASTLTSTTQERYLSGIGDTGSGVLIGLLENLNGGSSYTVALKHGITDFVADDVLTSRNVILTGFQLFIDDYDSPLPVTLSSFTAQYLEQSPVLLWKTQTESNNMGWNVYRGDNSDLGSSIQVNPEMIDGAGTTSLETTYRFIDQYSHQEGRSYYYWLESIETNGTPETFGPIELFIPIIDNNINDAPEFPEIYGLRSNYPNPFNPETEISYMLDYNSDVTLEIYNIQGQKIKTLLNNNSAEQGVEYIKVWNGDDETGKSCSSGIYYYRLTTDRESYIRKMMLVK